MKQINKYILRAAISPFIFGTSVVIFLFLIQFLMKHLDKLVGKGLENVVIAQLIIYNIAWMVILAIPLGVLFASLMAFGNLSANSETTIIKASGGSLFQMLAPMLLASALLSYALFLYDSKVVPETNHQAKILLYDIQRKKPLFAVEAGQFYNEINGYTILARTLDTSTNTLHNVTIYDLRSSAINRTINAASCNILFSENMENVDFILHNGEIFQSQTNSLKNYRQIAFTDYNIRTLAQGFGFEHSDSGIISRGDRELTIAAMQSIVDSSKVQSYKVTEKKSIVLKNYINFLINGTVFKDNTTKDLFHNASLRSNIDAQSRQNSDFNSNFRPINDFSFKIQSHTNALKSHKEHINRYEVEIHKKYAIPFACIVFVFIGCPLGIITRGGNFGLSAAITLGFYIVYWACLITGEDLADRMLIAPWLSMWFGNIVLGIVGIILMLKANSENLDFFNIFKRYMRSYYHKNK